MNPTTQFHKSYDSTCLEVFRYALKVDSHTAWDIEKDLETCLPPHRHFLKSVWRAAAV